MLELQSFLAMQELKTLAVTEHCERNNTYYIYVGKFRWQNQLHVHVSNHVPRCAAKTYMHVYNQLAISNVQRQVRQMSQYLSTAASETQETRKIVTCLLVTSNYYTCMQVETEMIITAGIPLTVIDNDYIIITPTHCEF